MKSHSIVQTRWGNDWEPRRLGQRIYSKVAAAVLVVDLTDSQSASDIQNWLQVSLFPPSTLLPHLELNIPKEVERYCPLSSMFFVLGNKADIPYDQHVITAAEVQVCTLDFTSPSITDKTGRSKCNNLKIVPDAGRWSTTWR
jgi:GTPase SAR1 family protein